MIKLREGIEKDIEVLAEFRLGMFKDMVMIQDETQAQMLVQVSKVYFRSIFGTDQLLSLVAEEEGKVVAAGILTIWRAAPSPANLSGEEGYIYNLYTLPNWRRKGIGTKIFNHLVETAKEKGVKYIWLYSTEDGRSIYTKMGFEPVTKAMDMHVNTLTCSQMNHLFLPVHHLHLPNPHPYFTVRSIVNSSTGSTPSSHGRW